jgi:hypothetical protein
MFRGCETTHLPGESGAAIDNGQTNFGFPYSGTLRGASKIVMAHLVWAIQLKSAFFLEN